MGQEKTIDFSALGKPVVLDDLAKDKIDLNMDEQPEIVQAAFNAIKSMNIPNSATSVFTDDRGHVTITKASTAFFQAKDSSYSTIHMPEKGITIDKVGIHEIEASIEIEPEKDGQRSIKMTTTHAGSYNTTVDATRAQVSYTIDKDGNFTDRDGNAIPLGYNSEDLGKPHGQWTIQAVQTLESNFAKIIGDKAQEQIMEQRSDKAATSVGAPPTADNMTPLSTIDFNKLGAGAAPALKVGMNF